METEAELKELDKNMKQSFPEFNKEKKKSNFKEFMIKWKEGIQNLTPTQKLSNELRATIITLIGSLVSLVALIIYRDKLIVSWFAYGLILVFLGNGYSQFIKFLSLRQQLRFFKNTESNSLSIDEVMNKLEQVKGGQEKC